LSARNFGSHICKIWSASSPKNSIHMPSAGPHSLSPIRVDAKSYFDWLKIRSKQVSTFGPQAIEFER